MHLITFLICKNDGTETGVFSSPIEFLSLGGPPSVSYVTKTSKLSLPAPFFDCSCPSYVLQWKSETTHLYQQMCKYVYKINASV